MIHLVGAVVCVVVGVFVFVEGLVGVLEDEGVRVGPVAVDVHVLVNVGVIACVGVRVGVIVLVNVAVEVLV